MKELSIEDRETFEKHYHNETLYHSFPLILALSETGDEKITWEVVDNGKFLWQTEMPEKCMLIYSGADTLLLDPYLINSFNKHIWASIRIPLCKCHKIASTDRNYLFRIKEKSNYHSPTHKERNIDIKKICAYDYFDGSLPAEFSKLLPNSKIDNYLLSRAKALDLDVKVIFYENMPAALSIWSVQNKIADILTRAVFLDPRYVPSSSLIPFLHEYTAYNTYKSISTRMFDKKPVAYIRELEPLLSISGAPDFIAPIYSWEAI